MMAEQPATAGGSDTTERWREMLVPVRGGPDALARVKLALNVAAAAGAGVTALYVMDERLLGDPDAALVREQLFQQLANEGELLFEAIRALPEARGVRLSTRMERGHVVEAVIRVAQDIDADVIVVGAHRQTWLGRLLGGSVAESILRAATCAVLAVPPARERAQATKAQANQKKES
jgi:nucleotide-binding universal stress UspA family protein